MKIVYLHQYFVGPGEPGGTRSYEFARRLVASGHDVHIITSHRSAGKAHGWSEERIAGIHVHRMKVPYDNRMSFPRRMWAFALFAIGSTLKTIRLAKTADVIFASSTPLTIAIPGMIGSMIRRVPMVFEVRDVWPEVPIALGALRNPLLIKMARWLEQLAYSRSSHIIALSTGMEESIIRSGVKRAKVSVIPNSCDLAEFGAHHDARVLETLMPGLGDAALVLYAGTIGIANGCSYLVEVAAQSLKRGDNIQFLIVGDGKEVDIVRQLAEERQVLGRNLFIHPPVPKSQVPAIMQHADLCVSTFIDVPALWANSANKFFDTLASGTPIAINYGGWQADLILSEGVGLVLPPTDHAAAAELIASLLLDQGALMEAGRRARKLAEDCFSRDKLAMELESVLAESAAKGYRP